MKIVKQIIIIFGVCIFSEFISYIIPVAIPGSLLSILILFVLLSTHVVKEKNIKETSDFLLKFMTVLFVPLGVGVVRELMQLQDKLFAVVVTILSSIVVTFLGGYFATLLVIKVQRKIKGGRS